MRSRFATCLALLLLLAAGSSAAEGRVYPEPEAVQPLQPGKSVPTARLTTVSGETLDLAAAVRDAGALLVFYRGGW